MTGFRACFGQKLLRRNGQNVQSFVKSMKSAVSQSMVGTGDVVSRFAFLQTFQVHFKHVLRNIYKNVSLYGKYRFTPLSQCFTEWCG